MPELNVTLIVPPELTSTLAALASPAPIFGRFLRSFGIKVQGIVRNKYLRGGSGRLNVRTGGLTRSIAVDTSDLPRAVSVGSHLIYAPVHEYGRAIKARPGKRLLFRDRRGNVTGSAYSVFIPPRPFIEPAKADAAREGPAILRAEIARLPGVTS